MLWFQCDKENSSNDGNINFTQIEVADESNDEDVSSHVESFEKKLRWFETQTKVCNATQLLTIKNFCDLAAKKIWDPQMLKETVNCVHFYLNK